MAKKIVDEILKYSVEINGNDAQKELFDLEKRQRKLQQRSKDLRAEKKRLIQQNKKGTAEWKRVTQELKSTNAEVKQTKTSMASLRKQIGLTALTPRQLRQEANRLKLALHNMIPGSAQAKRYQAELNKVNARMRELRVNGRRAGSSMGRLADKFSRYSALGVSVIATTTGIILSGQKLIDFNSKLADAQANVQKTTGLTKEQVDELTVSLGKIDTRTARIELLGIAEEAGRLGKTAIPEITAFAEAADQIKVALGDDLQGDINENVRVVGKLAQQYQVGAEFGADLGESMQMVGSAINEVAASGSNQAGYLVDILKRTSGMAQQADITADKIIGIAAAADEAGQRQEVTATALNKTFMNMAGNVETFAEVAGVSIEEFKQLIDEDANEAFLTLLKGLQGNDDGLRVMAQRFDKLGVDGARTVQVLGALSGNIDTIRKRQQKANTSMAEATSLYEEFMVKNENFAGVLDRVRKKVMGFVIGNPLTDWIKSSIVWFAKFIGAIEDTDGSVTQVKENIKFLGKIILVATTAFISYKAALKLVTLWTNRATTATWLQNVASKAVLVTTKTLQGATLLWRAAVAALTGNITRATAAMRLFTQVTRLSPWGLLAGLVAGATAAYIAFRKEQDKLTFKQRARLDLQKAAEKSTARERARLEELLAVARDETIAKEKRLEAMEKLRAIAPDYLGDIELEEINTLKAKKAIDQYIKSLERKAMAEALQEKRVDLFSKRVDKALSDDEENYSWFYKNIGQHTDKASDALWGLFGVQTETSRATEIATKNREKDVEAIDEQIKALNDLQNEMVKSGEAEVPGGDPAKPGPSVDADDLSDKEIDERQRAMEKIQDVLRKASGAEDEIIRDKYEKLIALAKKHKVDLVDELMAAMNDEIIEKIQEQTLAEWEEEERKNKEKQRKTRESEEKRQAIMDEYGLLTDEEKLKAEQDALEEAYEEELLKHEEYLAAKEALEEEYTERELEQWKNAQSEKWQLRQQLGQAFQDIITGLRDMELAGIEEVKRRDYEVTKRRGETEEQFQKRKEKAEKQFTKAKEKEEEKRHEVNKKYAVLEALATVAKITAQTALAVVKALPNIPLSIAMGAAGAVQAGVAMRQANKIRSYNQGEYDVIDQHGDNYRAERNEEMPTGLYSKPTVSFSKNKLVAEKQPELVIDPAVTSRLMRLRPEVIDVIRNERRAVHGYAQGDYAAMNSGGGGGSARELASLALATNNLNAQLELLRQQGVSANIGDRDIRKMKKLQTDFENIESNS